MAECIFCKIIAGDIPKATIYEDNDVLAFLDIDPIYDGHTLVVPKRHVRFVHELDDELYLQAWQVTKKIMHAIEKAFVPERVGVIVEGFGVDHAHIKVFPLYDVKDLQTPHVAETSDEYFEKIKVKLQSSL